MAPDDGSPLALDPELMRRLGYRTVDMLVDRITGPAGPVVRSATPEELHQRLSMPPPEDPAAFEEILEGLERDVLPFVARISHPGYLAFIPGEGTWPGALGDLIGSALNIDTCWWLGASGPSALELVVLDWFRQWVGYPEEAAGVLVSGGSAANLTALACAREARIGVMDARAVVYMSDQTHSSLARAARALGFRPDQVRVIPTDQRARMRPDALRGAIAADQAGGRRPLMVVANAGTTATGAVDPFHELSEICREQGIWLHVDGAYGAFACLSERGREVLAGMELADSITLDPHKWLYQPIELGALLVRDGSALRRGFEISPDFLKDVEAVDREVNFSDLGLQLTRSCRALKLWISLRYFGVAAFRKAIDRCLDLALHAQSRIESSSELELMSPASLGVVTFRRHPPRHRRRGGPGAHQREPGRSDRARRRGVRLDRAGARSLCPAAVRPQPLDVAGRGRPCSGAGGVAGGRSRSRSIQRCARELSVARGRLASASNARRRWPALVAAVRCPGRRPMRTSSAAPRTSTLPWRVKQWWSSGRSAGISTSS